MSVDDNYEQKVIDNFVDNELFAVDSRALRDYMSKSMPDIDLTWDFISEETGEERQMSLPIGVGFFWLTPIHKQQVHQACFDLIYHGQGGFTWADVYNMPVWARRFYTEKIVEFKGLERKAHEDAKKSRRGTRK